MYIVWVRFMDSIINLENSILISVFLVDIPFLNQCSVRRKHITKYVVCT